jgi:hypothetical protein
MTEPDLRYTHPDLQAIRARAVAQLVAEITPIAARHGHVRKGNDWERETAWCWSQINLQRSRGGFACYLNVRYRAKFFTLAYPINDTRVGMFADAPHQLPGTDSLFYVDIDGPTPLRDMMLGILKDRVMPYLDRCHAFWGLRERTHVPFGMMPA